MPRFRFGSSREPSLQRDGANSSGATTPGTGVPLSAQSSVNGDADPVQTRGLLEFLNARILTRGSKAASVGSADSSGNNTANSSVFPSRAVSPTPRSRSSNRDAPDATSTSSFSASASAGTAANGTVVLHLSYRGELKSVRVAPSLVPDVGSLRLLFASVFRLATAYVRDKPVYMQVAAAPPGASAVVANGAQSQPGAKPRGALFKLVNLVNEIPSGAILLLLDDRALLQHAAATAAAAAAAANQNRACPTPAQPRAPAAPGRCTCGRNHPLSSTSLDPNAALCDAHATASLCTSKSNSVNGSSLHVNEVGAPVIRSTLTSPAHELLMRPGASPLLSVHAGSATSLPQTANSARPSMISTSSLASQPQPQPQLQLQPQRANANYTQSIAHESPKPDNVQRVAERCRSINEQLLSVKDGLRDLRRSTISFRDSLNEQFAAAQRELRTMLVAVPGAQRTPLRRARFDLDVLFGAFERDEQRTLADLEDLHAVVAELRTQVNATSNGASRVAQQTSITESDSGVSSESGSSNAAASTCPSASGRPVLLNEIELESYALQLDKTIQELRTNKRCFPSLLERMKPVMMSETQQLVHEEQFLKTHDARLTEALLTCQQVGALLLTLKRVYALQKLERTDAAAPTAGDDVRRRLQLVTNCSPSHATKRAVLANIEALCPNSDARLRAIEQSEALHRTRKRFVAAFANLQMEKVLREKLAASAHSEKTQETSRLAANCKPQTGADDTIDALFTDAEKLVKQLDFLNFSPDNQALAGECLTSKNRDEFLQDAAMLLSNSTISAQLANSDSSSQETVIYNDGMAPRLFNDLDCDSRPGKNVQAPNWRLHLNRPKRFGVGFDKDRKERERHDNEYCDMLDMVDIDSRRLDQDIKNADLRCHSHSSIQRSPANSDTRSTNDPNVPLDDVNNNHNNVNRRTQNDSLIFI